MPKSRPIGVLWIAEVLLRSCIAASFGRSGR
jgi:hypothetical protein